MQHKIKLLCLLTLFTLGLTSCGYIDDPIDEDPTNESNDNYYSVSFVNYDGSFLYSDFLKEGSVPEYKGPTPKREKDQEYYYEFSGWDKPLTALTEETTYKATYSQSRILKYTVSFYDYDGSLLYETSVEEGETAFYNGEIPTREDEEKYTFEFSGWNKSLENITSDLSVTAQYTSQKRQYVVKFFNYDSTLLDVEKVFYGEEAFYHGEEPQHDDNPQNTFNFAGWDKDIFYITEDTDVYAEYDSFRRYYTVSYYNYDETLLTSVSVLYGEEATYPGKTPTKAPHLNKKYEFTGWSVDTSHIYHDTKVYAQYDELTRDPMTDLLYSYSNNQYIVTGYIGSETDIYIGKTYNDGINGEHSITGISSYAFESRYSIEYVYLEENITSIGFEAFADCNNLKQVVFPEALKFVEQDAFRSCISLNNISLGGRVERIASNSFRNCTSIESFKISESNKYCKIVDGVIYEPSSKKAVCSIDTLLPDDLTIIDGTEYLCENLFYDSKNLKSITIPSSVLLIGPYCFYSCGSLTTAVIEDAPCTIEYCAFYEASNLKTVDLGDKVISISWQCFYYTSVESLYIPKTTSFISDSSFVTYYSDIELTVDADNPYFFVFDNAVYSKTTKDLVAIGYRSSSTLVLTKDIILTNSTRNILNNGLIYYIDLEEGCVNYTISNNIFYSKDFSILYFASNIGDNVVLLDTVREIKENAFYNCYFSTITLNDNITAIPSNCFSNCYNLEKVNFGKNIESIGDYAFYQCNSLTTIDLTNTKVKTIAEYAFSYCSSLRRVALSDSTISLGNYAFYSCDNLTQINFNESFERIGIYCFYYSKIKKFDFSNTKLISIGEWAFSFSRSLTDVIFSECIKSIGSYAFSYCSKLEKIDFSKTKESITFNNAFNQINNIKTIIFGDDLEDINTISNGSYVFEYCTIENFELPSHLSFIENLFYKCDIKELSLPSSFVGNYSNLFESCTINKIIVDSSAKSNPYNENVFGWGCEYPDVYFTTDPNTFTDSFCQLPGLVGTTFYSETYKQGYWHYDENGNIVVWAESND